MTEVDVIDKPLLKDSGDENKPELVPAHTKPHYWLYKQGREIWNRWAREAFIDENGNDDGRIDEWIKQAEEHIKDIEKSSHWGGGELTRDLQKKVDFYCNFKDCTPLSDQEKGDLEKKIRKEAKSKKYSLPSVDSEIDFIHTDWQEEVIFVGYVFPVRSNFIGSRFAFSTGFNYSSFVDYADFRSAHFMGNANFSFTIFGDEAYFSKSEFKQHVDFISSIFYEYVEFSSIDIQESASFSWSRFQGSAYFDSSNFVGNTYFNLTVFTSVADFGSSSFESFVSFDSVVFVEHADFSSSNFSSNADFSSIAVSDVADFTLATFFLNVRFCGAEISFLKLHKTVFEGDGNFEKAVFETLPKVSGVNLFGVFNFNEVIWPQINICKQPLDDALSYSQLKRLMNDSHLHHMEIFFFRKELLCRAESHKRSSKKLLDEDGRMYWFIKAYDKISECGDSITRPLRVFLYLHIVMAVFYMFISDKLGALSKLYSFDFSGLYKGFYLSLRHSILFLPTSKKNYEAVMESMFPTVYGTGQFDLSYIIYVFASGMQTVLSIGLIFLVGLAIRNHLRIK